MNIVTGEELKEILSKHKKWLFGEDGGERTDLSYADLRSADLRSADLHYADLSYANLRSADLSYANLRSADLRSADLRSANLRYADLRYADLSYADLSYADLSYADLRSANLNSAKGIHDIVLAYTNQCPQEGSFIAFKKAKNKIVKLLIPEDAKRSNSTGNKCRCDKAKVLAIYDKEHHLLNDTEVISDYDEKTVYKVGDMVIADKFDENRWNECSNGIHFFLTFEMAVIY